MTIQEAIQLRHSVRSYKDVPLSEIIVNSLQSEIAKINEEGCLHAQLILNEPKAFQGTLAKYGKFRGVNSYIVMAGKKADKCSRCNEYFNETEIAKLAHTYGKWETVVEPTCTEKGFNQRVCNMCKQASETKETAALGHSQQWVFVTRPTFKYTGTEKLTCSRCKTDLGKTRSVARVYPDLDGDKRFTAADALLILQHSTELKLLSAAQQKNADCDGDGRINSADALIILQLSVGLQTY